MQPREKKPNLRERFVAATTREEPVDIASKSAKLDRTFWGIAISLKSDIEKQVKKAEAGEAVQNYLYFNIAGLELPAALLKREIIEEMSGYRALHDICKAEDFDLKIDVTLRDKSRIFCGNDGSISVTLDSPYLKSSLNFNGTEVWTPIAPKKPSAALEKDLLAPTPLAKRKPE